MEDMLKRLGKLTQEEARMAVADNLKVTHVVDESEGSRGCGGTVAVGPSGGALSPRSPRHCSSSQNP